METVEFLEEGSFEWIVPPHVKSVIATVTGAETMYGGYAATVVSTIPVAKNHVFNIINGGVPSTGSGGSNGGGNGVEQTNLINDGGSYFSVVPTDDELLWSTAGGGRTDLYFDDELVTVAGGAGGPTVLLTHSEFYEDWYVTPPRPNVTVEDMTLVNVLPSASEPNRLPSTYPLSYIRVSSGVIGGVTSGGGTDVYSLTEDIRDLDLDFYKGAGGGGYGGGASGGVFFTTSGDQYYWGSGRLGTSYSSGPANLSYSRSFTDIPESFEDPRPGSVVFAWEPQLADGWTIDSVGF